MALEGDDAEDEGEQVGIDQRSTTAKGMLMSGTMKRGSSVSPFHSMKSGNLVAVARRMHQGVVDLERQRDEIGANAEIDRLTEAQDAGEAPDQVDAEGEDGEAEELAKQQENVAVGSAEVRESADGGDDERAEDQAPRSGETAPARWFRAPSMRGRFLPS